jgi:hypothetical protein
MANWQNIKLMSKQQIDENGKLTKDWVYEMTDWQNRKLMNWQKTELIKWQIDKTGGWWIDKLSKESVDEMANWQMNW